MARNQKGRQSLGFSQKALLSLRSKGKKRIFTGGLGTILKEYYNPLRSIGLLLRSMREE